MKQLSMLAYGLLLTFAVADFAIAQSRIVTSGEVRCAIRSWFHPSAGHHFYAPAAEANPAGWVPENVRFVTFATKTSSSQIPLFRMFRPGGGHFYTSNAAERNAVIARGFSDEGHIGYVYADKRDDLVPLHRWYKPGIDRHFYSASKEEGDRAGFTYEGVVGWVRPANTAGQVELACRVAGLDAAVPPETPDWAKKTEYCFGAIGNGCGGDGERAAAAASLLLSLGYLLPRAGVKLSCYSDGINSKEWCWVSTGSIKHDNCCLKNPDGNFCKGREVKGAVCTAEWDEAVRATMQGRAWIASFGLNGMQKSDLEPVPSPRNRYPAGEVRETARLCAPTGTYVDAGQEAFCCSGLAIQQSFMGDRWALCSDRMAQSVGEVPADRAQPVIAFNDDTIREMLKGTPRATLALQRASGSQTSGGMGATAGATDVGGLVRECQAEAKRKGSDARHCLSLRRMP